MSNAKDVIIKEILSSIKLDKINEVELKEILEKVYEEGFKRRELLSKQMCKDCK